MKTHYPSNMIIFMSITVMILATIFMFVSISVRNGNVDLRRQIFMDQMNAYDKYLESMLSVYSPKKAMTPAERAKKYYDKRRKQGLCLQAGCNSKDKETNPYTGNKYRKCEEHRLRENHLSKKRREQN